MPSKIWNLPILYAFTPWPTGYDGAFGPCSHMAFFLHDRDLVGICSSTADCVYRQWFLEVFLSPFSNVSERIMIMGDAVSSKGPKTTGIQQRSSAVSLTQRDFSSFSESFYDDIHSRLDLQSLCNLTSRNVESLCPSLILRDSASLRHPFYS